MEIFYKRPTKLSKQGAQFISRFEGLVLRPYNDPTNNATIGIGHLLHTGKVTTVDAKKWANFTEEQAFALLQEDAQIASNAVNKFVKAKINQKQHDALVSFVFNVGVGAFESSTLLKVINSFPGTRFGIVSKKAKIAVREQLVKWDRSAGVVLPGLERRRIAEADLFAFGKYL